jgi:translation initiation factor IF-2
MTDKIGTIRLSKAVKEIGVGIGTIIEYLASNGHKIENNPNAKITDEQYSMLLVNFQSDKKTLEDAKLMGAKAKTTKKEEIAIPTTTKPKQSVFKSEDEDDGILIKTGLVPEMSKPEPVVAKKEEETPPVVIEEKPVVEEIAIEDDGKMKLKVVGKIDLESTKKKPTSKKKKTEEEIAADTEVENKKNLVKKAEEKEPVAESITPEVVETPTIELPIPAETNPEVIVPDEVQTMEPNYEKLSGLKVMGKIVLPVNPPPFKKPTPIASSDDSISKKKRRRKTSTTPGSEGSDIKKVDPKDSPFRRDNKPAATGSPRPGDNRNRFAKGRPNTPEEKTEITEKEIQDKLKETLARLNPGSKQPNIGAVRSKLRKQKRTAAAAEREEAMLEEELSKKTLKVTEFVTANELANMMDVQVTQVISACMTLGMMVSINQRLDAETISIVADEFGYEVDFTSADELEEIEEEIDAPEDLATRPPIVTVMGHVDHGKTSLLDYIRSANVIAGEAGGITQHIGAYEVTLSNGKQVTFLDTPGHEAFTAMRARGAKLTDIVIIVIAADDSVMPQTKEAISHAQAAGVPIIFAFNKIDKDGANPDKIREQLSAMNILVEEWGGKYQTQEISAKKGLNIDSLLEKVLLESEMLDLKANPNKRAVGSVIEATLDKGRGITTTIMVQSGTLRVGDPILAGVNSGKVRAMFDERGKKITMAGPSTPVVMLGFDGAPQAGDKFIATKNEQEAKEIANKRNQLMREQGIRTQKHITLDEIGRRLAIGNFKELKVIVKGDVDGSVEALSDSLIKLSTEEVQVSVIYSGVGQISESDVLLASASDAIIVGFQVRPSQQARKLAETESIDIRLYSIIYNAIEEIKGAIEGMLAPTVEEKITGNADIREVFKVSKVGVVAGCMVTDGKIYRNSKVRLIRDGVVVYTGELSSLKRFKDDVKEVSSGYDCGLTIGSFNDLKEGDQVEAYEMVETKRKLK